MYIQYKMCRALSVAATRDRETGRYSMEHSRDATTTHALHGKIYIYIIG